jgi:hypothetical protein
MARTSLAVVVALASMRVAYAQQTEPAPPFPVIDVALAPLPVAFEHGKAATYHGAVNSTLGSGFRLSGLSMMQPVAVTVVAAANDKPVRLAIGKTWASPDRTVETGSDGTVTELFRTDDLAEIHVRAVDGAEGEREYGIVIWVGDEKSDYPDMPSDVKFGKPEDAKTKRATVAGGAPSPAPAPPVAPAAAPAQAPAAGTSPVLWVIAALLGVLVVFAGIFLLRRKK